MLKSRTKDLLRFFLIALVAAGSTVLLSAGPAQAAYWQPYNSNPSTWRCSDTPARISAPAHDGYFYVQACVVRNGSFIQAIEVITNTSSSATRIFSSATVKLVNSFGAVVRTDSCPSSQLGPKLTRACFGKTLDTTDRHLAIVALDQLSDASPLA